MQEMDNFPQNKMTASQTIEVQVIENEDEALRYTQGKRQQIVEALIKKDLNDLNSAQISLLSASLDGIDRSAMGRKRLKSDEKIGSAAALAAAVIAQVLAAPGAMQVGQAAGIRTAIPQLPTDVPEPIIVPGEMDSDAPQMDYNTFMAQAEKA